MTQTLAATFHLTHQCNLRCTYCYTGTKVHRPIEKAIPILLRANPCASVTTVLTPFSAGHAAESIDWLYQKGFRYFNLTLDYSADWTMEDMHRLEKSYHQLARWYEEKMQQNQRFYLSCSEKRDLRR
ncbi:hypothetical protein [Haliscomenobacter sp.]|uniref:hypothetical protein n=1 Tax=Haliscomenobacter sp. TaxID=2717303 RepID=UPI003592F72A